jgi:PHD/YefM family antitoxin component YafN of YafNO toxin-antitoxin module
MVKIKPEFLVKNGKREFVILTARDFDRVIEALEDAEDLRVLREARRKNANSPTYTLEEVKRRLGIAPPRGRKASRSR